MRAMRDMLTRPAFTVLKATFSGAVTPSRPRPLARTLRAESAAGGLCTRVYRVRNCYNVGKVSLKGSGYVGGLSASIDVNYGNTTNNYSIGTVTASSGMKNGAYAAALFPHYEGVEMQMKNKCMIYDNYYNGCARAYGISNPDPSVQKREPKATKVSSVTSGSCPKLSSKYWTYSSKFKRLVLKNNMEK